MKVTAEISLYPLSKDYEGPIISFIKELKANKELVIFTHSLSTYVQGDSEAVFSAINKALLKADETNLTCCLNIKLFNKKIPIGPDTYLDFN